MRSCYGMLILLALLLFLLTLPAAAQSSVVQKSGNTLEISKQQSLSLKIFLTLENVPLAQALNQIASKGGFRLSYSEVLLPSNKKVTLKLEDVTLLDALVEILKDTGFDFVLLEGGILAITPKERAEQETSIIIGRILEARTNKPIPGANIVILGTGFGAAANAEGNYRIERVPPGSYELRASAVGFAREQKNITVVAGQQVPVDFFLDEETIGLDEIQVIAYSTTSRRLNTGNVSTLKATEIEKQPVSNPLLALQGRVPGMEISQATGLPGSGVVVRIRGQNSIAYGNQPLYIVDGVPYPAENLPSSILFNLGASNNGGGGFYSPGSPFNFLDPSHIESISILKDADATAIYGSRGANGVVLITTKKGYAGSMGVDINVQNGWGIVGSRMNLLNLRQYLDMRYEALRNDNATPNPNADYDLTLWDTTRATDWQDVLIGGVAKYTDVQVALFGGTDLMQYRVAFGYHRETTVFPGDFRDVKGSAQVNVNGRSPDQKFTFSLSALYTRDDNQLSWSDLTQLIMLAPNAPALYNSDGSINWAQTPAGVTSWAEGSSPASQMLIRFKSLTNNLVTNAVLTYRIFPGLSIKSSLGFNSLQSNDFLPLPMAAQNPAMWSTYKRGSNFNDNSIESWIIEPQIEYGTTISNGWFSALVGFAVQQRRAVSEGVTASGFNSDLVLGDIGSATDVTAYSTVNSMYKYNAVFGRLSYDWQNKYLINLTARRDGSSRFGPANRFHNFAAIGAGWIFSEEDFVRNSADFLSYGKLRASYGTTGNDQVGDYSFLDLFDPDAVGVPYQGTAGLRPSKIFTPDLAWEETKKYEAGLELGFLNDRVSLSVSHYVNRSSNQLLSYPLPSTAGFTSIQTNLEATVQNKGWEFELRAIPIDNPGDGFRWSTSFTISLNRNKLISGAPGLSEFYQQKIGFPVNSFFVYRFLGVNLITGLYEFADTQGNPTTNPNPSTDRTVLIDPNPDFSGGFQNSISFKGIQIDFLIQFVKRPFVPIFVSNYLAGYFGSYTGSNQPVDVLRRWRTPGDVTSVMKFSRNTANSYSKARDSDLMWEDGSYIRLKNVSVSWKLPEAWIPNARMYVRGQNLFTITKYKGLDPETGGSLVSTLPPLRVVTIGLSVGV